MNLHVLSALLPASAVCMLACTPPLLPPRPAEPEEAPRTPLEVVEGPREPKVVAPQAARARYRPFPTGVVGAAYIVSRDVVVTATASPPQLLQVVPDNGEAVSATYLSAAPVTLALTLGEGHALVATERSIIDVDLSTSTTRDMPVHMRAKRIAATDETAYLFPERTVARSGGGMNILDLESGLEIWGAERASELLPFVSDAKVHRDGNYLYTANGWMMGIVWLGEPRPVGDALSFLVGRDDPTGAETSPPFTAHRLWLSRGGDRLYLEDAHVYDLHPGFDDGVHHRGLVEWDFVITAMDDHPETNTLVAIMRDDARLPKPGEVRQLESERFVRVYDRDTLALRHTLTLPSFVEGEQERAAFGELVFLNEQGTKAYVVAATHDLASRTGIAVLDLTTSPPSFQP
jgi:hypothetical protein